MIEQAALILAKVLGVLFILAVSSVCIATSVAFAILEFCGRIALALARSSFAHSGGLIAALFGGAVWVLISALRGP